MTTTSNKNKKTVDATTSNRKEVSNGMESIIYSTEGKKVGTIDLPEAMFGLPWNDALMHQVVIGMQANARTLVAHAKTRGEVRGGGKKPWRQKGTGRARHGSIRSPIWKGGGVTHGPRNDRNYTQEIPKKMRAKALFVALSRKLKDGQILFIDSIGLNAPKTAEAKKVLSGLGSVAGFEKMGAQRGKAVLVALFGENVSAKKSFSNIGNVECVNVRNLNPVTVLGHKYIIMENPEAAIKILGSRITKKLQATS